MAAVHMTKYSHRLYDFRLPLGRDNMPPFTALFLRPSIALSCDRYFENTDGTVAFRGLSFSHNWDHTRAEEGGGAWNWNNVSRATLFYFLSHFASATNFGHRCG
ncbi:hypothetical protein BDZ94DRAFT_602438 [Collybia nuda]|uniref:Uncharacterized protein n=1 Tax=Collybia nuda TaxID=64659 RepID=A0A9P6CIQ8_9AGAR|nr:hypothetical protein BDZ94DRAFT_602438 [Collybia nuda]